MNFKNEHREVKYPENKQVAAKLKRGDPSKIAGYANLSVGYIRDVLYGFFPISDKIMTAITKVLQEREDQKSAFRTAIKKAS